MYSSDRAQPAIGGKRMAGDDNEVDETQRLAKVRAFFARYVAVRGATRDPRIEEAFASVPREPFAGPGPWFILAFGPWHDRSDGGSSYVQTPDDDPAFLYQDVLIALDAQRRINIGEPSLHAHCLDALGLQPGETVLQIGAGSGYYTAILANLVGADGHVHAFEIDPVLAERARRNVIPWPQVKVEARSGTVEGLPKADAIYVNAGITQPSWTWLEALHPGGRLLFPLQQEKGWGGMLLVQSPAQGGLAWPARFISRAAFIACQARQDADIGRGLTAAFGSGDFENVKSIRFDCKPDDTCWFNGGDWWLSTNAL
jgi:protein-L-isoaspartate(D-aspartate) O-methyltransferase